MKTKTSANANPEGLHNSPKLSLATSQQGKMLKTLNKFLALVLVVAGLSMVQPVLGAAATTPLVLEATAFYGKDYTPSGVANTNNTWSPYTSNGTFGTCTTTAHGVTITSSKMTVNSANFKVKDGESFSITASSGYKIYRVVIKGVAGAQNNLTKSNGVWGGSDTWLCGDPFWGFTKGKDNVSFTNNYGDDYQINSINVYTYRTATSSQASISTNTFTISADNVESKSTTLTTNLGPFNNANTPYYNCIDTDVDANVDVGSGGNFEFDEDMYSTTYNNGSNIRFDVMGSEPGTYSFAFMFGRQSDSNTAANYYMVALWIPFTIVVEDACANTPTVAFTQAGPINKKVGDAAFTNAATVKYNNVSTGQTITYSSSDTDVATVNPSTGAVTLGSKIGSTTITASVESNGNTYCGASASYTINLSAYTVTYHYPSCATTHPSNATNVSGSLSLPTNMDVDGYSFAGWTDHAVTTNPSSVSPLYTSSVSVSSDMNLYAVYMKTSSTFTLLDKGTTAPTAGEYVIVSSYSAGLTKVLTTDIDNKYKIAANVDDYTITSAKTLSCQEEACIWTIAAVSGGFTVRNNSTGQYLSAASGAAGSSDQKLRLEGSTGTYTTWSISRAVDKVQFTMTNNKRNTDSEERKNLMCSGDYYAFYGSGTPPYLFKRASAAGTYTSNPDCNAAEYTVTIQNPAITGSGSATASATGGTWSSPVLSGLHGSETVTITATPATGYQFTSWTVTGASPANSSTSPTTFTMPTQNVRVTPNFTPQTYTIEYRDKGGANAASFSGSHVNTPSTHPTSHTYGTATTLNEATKSGYVFMGWFAESDCSGTRVNTLGATDYTSGPIVLYALWMRFSDYLAWCPEPTVTLTGGENVYVTGTNGKTIMAVNKLTLNASNLVANSIVQLTTPAGSGVSFSTSRVKYNATSTALNVTAGLDGNIDDQEIYVHYSPASAATVGAEAAPQDVTVTATYQTNTDYYSTQNIHVRNMPSAFALAVKFGGNWYALPANIASASHPAGVLIDVDESNWTCKGPSTLAYQLWPVKSTTGSGDVYSVRGEKLRFSGNGNKGLYGSTSTTTVNNYAGISAIDSNPEANYEWAVTTTVDGSTWKYTLNVNTDESPKYLRYYNSTAWGTYASGINEIYMIPLNEVATASVNVMEWGESEVALKCAANTTLTSVKINGTEVSPKPSLTSLGGDIYKLTGGGMPNLSTLATYAMKKMVIEVSESSTAKQAVFIIPFILTSTNSPAATPKTTIDLRNFAAGSSQDAKNLIIRPLDIVIRDGAQLDVTTASGNATACTFNNLYIYPGGKMNISANDIHLQNIYLRGGFSWLELPSKNEANFRLPQMKVTDGKSISGIGESGNGVYYDFYGDNSIYYMMALPKDVPVTNITNEENGDDWDAWIKSYNGAKRITDSHANCWEYSGSLTRGIGYEVAVKPRSTGAMSGRKLGILRFKLMNSAWADETAATPSVTAHGIAGYNANPKTVTANNVGWNLMGNPFFTALTSNQTTNIETKGLVENKPDGVHWDGTYVFTNEKVKYFTVPRKLDYDYDDVRANNAKLDAFYPFFVQVTTTAASPTLNIAATARTLKAPAHLAPSNTQRELTVDFIISDSEQRTDAAGLNISDDYSADFDIEDKEKTIDLNTAKLKLYTVMDGYRIAFNSLPESAIQQIPVGFITAQGGEMSIALSENSDFNYFDKILLIDNEDNIEWDLLQDAYTFTTDAQPQGNDTRFVLQLHIKQGTDIGTGIDNITGSLDRMTAVCYDGTLVLHGVPDGAELWVYDMNGKLISYLQSAAGYQQSAAGSQRMELEGLPVGVYNLRVVKAGEARTLRVIVR